MTVTRSFTAAGQVSLVLRLAPGARATYSITGTFVGTVTVERLSDGLNAALALLNSVAATPQAVDAAAAGVIENATDRAIMVRMSSKLTGVSAWSGTAVANLIDVASATVAPGAAQHGTVTAIEEGNGGTIKRTVLTFSNLPLTLANAVAAAQGAGRKIYTFPEGIIQILSASGKVNQTTTSDPTTTLNGGVTCNWGVGSTTQANKTLATTEQNIIPTTALTASASQNVAGADSKAFLAAPVTLDGTTTPIDLFLNVGVLTDTDLDADATVLLNGSITFTWQNAGDY